MNEPKLEKPGAGLPLLEALYLRFYMGPIVSKHSDWNENWQTFHQVNNKIIAALKDLSEEALTQRVLVPRLKGIEDSSRYWSAAMTLEHLMIVGTVQKKVIESLSKNIVPAQTASVADFKPKGGKGGRETLAEYQRFVSGMQAEVEALTPVPPPSRPRFRHPWCGPFSILQWQWMFAAHTIVHYRQIKAIIERLEPVTAQGGQSSPRP